MKENENHIDEFEQQEIDSQLLADSLIFSQWCKNLIELNEFLSNKFDKYYEKVFYICLWEILINTQLYIESLIDISLKESHHDSLLKMITEIKHEITDDEYFMLQYYRNCSCHIFLTKYSLLDENNNLKNIKQKETFYDKNGKKYKLTQSDIRKKVQNVIGKYGLEENLFKKNIRKRIYTIINNYKDFIVVKSTTFEDIFGIPYPHL